VFFFKIVALLLFIAQKIKTTEAIKYHQKKALFVANKDVNFVWLQRRTTAQLSVKATQCRITKHGLVIEQPNLPGLKWLRMLSEIEVLIVYCYQLKKRKVNK